MNEIIVALFKEEKKGCVFALGTNLVREMDRPKQLGFSMEYGMDWRNEINT